VLPARAPGLGDHRVLGTPGLVEELELAFGLHGVGGGVDPAQVAGDGLAVGVGDVAHAGADHVHDAGLHPGLGVDRGDRLGEPGQPVDAGDQDV
jgi:hypothetical protein